MAKLYPPSIAGALPSFYTNGMTNLTTVVIPFSLNKVVSASQVAYCVLRLKRTDNDAIVTTMPIPCDAGKWKAQYVTTLQLEFNLDEDTVKRLHVGSAYKAQIAYVDIDAQETGYYSSVGIIKYTSEPVVTLAGFNTAKVNAVSAAYVGLYKNSDISEKVYQYKFTLCNFGGQELETSGWKVHNAYNDTDPTSSIDEYIFSYYIGVGNTYTVQYSVKTGSGLEVNSIRYLVAQETTIATTLRGNFSAKADYENGCAHLYLTSYSNESEAVAETGSFLITRRSSKDNFTSQIQLYNFTLINETPNGEIFVDYTVEHGITYIYGIQQWNNENIHSNRIETEPVKIFFEDAFLYDGKRQLRIRFNAKVSSFKTVISETKKNTLGSKYPYFFRNGYIAYKEFPINGLISYMMDNDEHFIKREDLGYKGYIDSFNATDDNIAFERRFKLEVLDWLNNGQIKLFKSPQEGNYIVRLTNVSLTPNDVLGRMLHTFQCTADEVADFMDSSLVEFGLVDLTNQQLKRMRYKTVVFSEFVEDKMYDVQLNGTKLRNSTTIEEIANMDLTDAESLYHVKISDAYPGTYILIGDTEIMIGATGQYEMLFDAPVFGLKLKNPSRNMPGQVTYGTMTSVTSYFDLVQNIDIIDIPVHQEFGPKADILAQFNNIKHEISTIYFLRFAKRDVVEVDNDTVWRNLIDGVIESSPYNLYHYQGVYHMRPYPFVLGQEGKWLEVPYDTTITYRTHNEDTGEFEETILDVYEREQIMVRQEVELPDTIDIGAGAYAEISMRQKVLTYGIELTDPTLVRLRDSYLNTLVEYKSFLLGYKTVSPSTLLNPAADTEYYAFDNESFVPLDPTEYRTYASKYANQANKIFIVDVSQNLEFDSIQARMQYEGLREVQIQALAASALRAQEQYFTILEQMLREEESV